jgi:hypothetical protein
VRFSAEIYCLVMAVMWFVVVIGRIRHCQLRVSRRNTVTSTILAAVLGSSLPTETLLLREHVKPDWLEVTCYSLATAIIVWGLCMVFFCERPIKRDGERGDGKRGRETGTGAVIDKLKQETGTGPETGNGDRSSY